MADEHHAALELVDGLGQRVDGLDVQVIGGLVQEQHVRVLPGQPGEAHAALLTVRQVLDGADLSERRSGRDDLQFDLPSIPPRHPNASRRFFPPRPTCCLPVNP